MVVKTDIQTQTKSDGLTIYFLVANFL